MKQAAARGVLPVSREELIEILAFLADDPDPGIAPRARQSLEAFPDEVLKPLLESSFTSESLFQYFSRPPFRSQPLIEAIILNTATPDTVIARLSAQVDASLIEAILINLMRLLRSPEILSGLESNPHNTPDIHRRLGEIRHEFFEKRNTFVPVAPFVISESSPSLGGAAATETHEEIQFPPLSTKESPKNIVAATATLLEQDGESMTPERATTLQKIARMTVAERIQLALKGSRDDRMILIRDSNKVVTRAVLQSPKISDNEVEWIAQMRNVNEEVLRIIGTARAWAKNYSIIHNLVRNSRAPIAVSLPLINRLLVRDVKALSKNKNIPDVIRKTAHRLVQIREQVGG